MEYTLWMHCEEIVKMSWLCLPLSHIRFLQPSPDLLGEVVFLPLYLWDTLTENLEMQSCPFSFHHYGEISSVPSVFLKLKPVFFQRQRNCTEFSRCLKTLAEIYWFKNLTLKKRRISCFGGWKMPFNCKWTIQQSRFLSICFKKLLKDYYWKKSENDKAYYRVPQRSHSYRVCRTCLRNTGMQGWHCPSG